MPTSLFDLVFTLLTVFGLVVSVVALTWAWHWPDA